MCFCCTHITQQSCCWVSPFLRAIAINICSNSEITQLESLLNPAAELFLLCFITTSLLFTHAMVNNQNFCIAM